ncbi:phytanoyl-CoA dioxygenase family protein [Arthrobacter sp. SLBN-53]|uniref:phytanoyl-CoA dioxygenase family protein n=1 Tax=Arthrobacter sp. SLBN-53 TaxID=2768412 RepID=UPI0011505C18|nr:phytanoyl-CoA dioxygenase family protein [Arthrobacter sp. SLBN-53]TQK31834.1 phytanoyl-CoA dioxygenase PhyH [Arthrobacter sp. SLBN-53]
MLDVDRFIADGFVKIESAFDRELGLRCQQQLWQTIGLNPADPSTWTESLVRVAGMATPEFTAAANTDALHAAYNALVGPGRWRPRLGLGTFPLRFPSTEPARDAGWHVEASFYAEDGMRLSLRSRGRALLMLFLFSDVGPDDAPTMIRVGSHLAVPTVLAHHGPDGAPWMSVCEHVVPATADCSVVKATGRIGDVYLCHPFLVHTGTAHRGNVPRFMAQPPLEPTGELDLEADEPSPVARAVLQGLR